MTNAARGEREAVFGRARALFLSYWSQYWREGRSSPANWIIEKQQRVGRLLISHRSNFAIGSRLLVVTVSQAQTSVD